MKKTIAVVILGIVLVVVLVPFAVAIGYFSLRNQSVTQQESKRQ